MIVQDYIIILGENKMLLKEAFYKTINLLETYYNSHKQCEALISILSDFDCTVFQDGKFVDQATYEDWKRFILPYIRNEEVNDDDVKEALINFLVFYQEEFGYDLKDIIEYLKDIR